MTSPKVCIFTETYYPVIGGGETQARLLAKGLVVSGSSVIILTRRSDPLLAKHENFEDVDIFRLAPSGEGQLKKWGLLFSSFPKLVHMRQRYDLIFVSGFRIIGVSAVIVSRLFGKGCVLKADSQGEMSGTFFEAGLARVGMRPSSWPFRLFLKVRNAILRRATAFTAITNDTVEELLVNDVKPETIHRIPNCVDTKKFFAVNKQEKQQLRRRLGIPIEKKTVIYTGRLVSYKGLPLLLEVWHEIVKVHSDVLLILVGSGGLDIHNCENDLKDYVAENSLGETVNFTGSVRNVPEYLQSSDIFVFPTENDAFPSSLIEAMSCELPVIATPVGAIKTILENGTNGLLVQTGDFKQLHDALNMLLTNAVLANRLGKAGWQTVLNHFSADIVTQQYIDLFRSVSAQSSVSRA